MRAGGCTVQQALTTEAASVVKQAVTLARRRGHAQVTPLHVATTMLAPPAGLLRTACLQSHSHPLQCKALDVCINVALNRLPASSASSPILGPHHSNNHPSISNALVAAFKRAQAHQRRGSVENQQQPLLAVKIELEQLIISILDDPSVSRVMREAGFSSTQVKINIENAVSLELCSSQQPLPSISCSANRSKEDQLDESSKKKKNGDDDIASVIENMMSKRRKSIAIVGECISSMERVVKGLMEKVERGEVPEGFREVKFISLPLFSLGNLCREEVEKNLVELRCLVRSFLEKGVVLYLGDLKWTTENRVMSSSSCDDHDEGIRKLQYCPVEHMIVELGRLVCGIGESCERFWLMGIATFQTYRRCRTGSPSLDIVWGLHPLTIPEASLSLSLIPESDVQSDSESKKCGNGSTWLMLESGNEKELNRGGDQCCNKFNTEAQSFRSSSCTSEATASTLPSWLQQYKDQTSKRSNDNDQECVRPAVKNLCRKWNSFCTSTLKQPFYTNERTITFSSLSPSSSTTGFSYDLQNPNFHHTPRGWPAFEPKQYLNDQHFSASEQGLRIYIPDHKEPRQAFSSNPNSTASSDVVMDTEGEDFPRFKEWTSENLKTLCTALETRVPWQKDIIPEIASTILQCRSGMVRRKGRLRGCEAKEETWLFFQGVDVVAKEKIARELSRLVFGSNDLVSISLSSFSSTRADSTEDYSTNKRSRDEQSCSYIERFAEAVGKNPSRVFLVEDVEQVDYCSQMGIKRAIERGRISDSNGHEVRLCDAIVILSCESFSSRSRAPSPSTKQNSDGSEQEKETSPCVSLDLNISFDEDDDESGDHNESIDDVGLLESVDRRVFFKIQEL